MTRTSELAIIRASVQDAEEILDLQKLAYQSEAEIIDDFTIPPLHQKMDEIVAEFSQRDFLKVELDGKIIGSVRVHVDGGTCYIGKLIVDPDYQNLGLGTRLLRAAEEQFPDSERYELFTGEKSEKNLYIYERSGYQVFKSEVVSEKLTLMFLERVTGQ